MLEYDVWYIPSDNPEDMRLRTLIAETLENAIEGFYMLFPDDDIYCVNQRLWTNPDYCVELGA